MQDVGFDHDGTRLSGTWYWPRTGADAVAAPVAIAAPGFGGVKEMGLPSGAEILAAAGIAVLTFDYAGFGGSEGEPRQHVDPQAQLAQFRSAISYVSTVVGIDPERIGLWGISLAGGHALRLAATDDRVKCAVSIVPFVEVNSGGAPPELIDAIVADVAARSEGKPHGTVPIVGRPGELCVLTNDGALEWVQSQIAGIDGLDDFVTLASLVEASQYRPLDGVVSFRSPVRVIVGTEDTVNPASLTMSALEPFGSVDVVEFPATHFSIFEEHSEAMMASTLEWFTMHL
jgi:dienelactone hydrolase